MIFLCVLSWRCTTSKAWWEASREPSGLAPQPEEHSEAIVLIYTARAFSWRGTFGVHPWIAWKEKDAPEYTTAQVIGWRLRRTSTSIVVEKDQPDRYWFGSTPSEVDRITGAVAERAIPKIKDAIANYPYGHIYRVYPGPNSNTFIAHVIREVPELGVELPSSAIGKDWVDWGWPTTWSQSGTGVHFSLWGLAGFTLGLGDGVEVHLLGLNLGVDLWTPALKLPFVGRIGFPDAAVWRGSEP